MFWQCHILPRKSWLAAILAVIGVVTSFLPWFPMLLGHFNRSETNWLPQHNTLLLYIKL
jgi:hypothetical protein